jgi:hypothetical protein
MRAAPRASAQGQQRQAAVLPTIKALLVFEEPIVGLLTTTNNDRAWASTIVWAPIRAAKDLRDTP